ncbi:hypothetical protein CYMTET_28819, partial [Cymbomonas tetramitiformis]
MFSRDTRRQSDVIEVFVAKTLDIISREASTRTKEGRALKEACQNYTSKKPPSKDASPETQGPLSIEEAELILEPLHLACKTQLPKLLEPALGLLHKLIAHGYLQAESSHKTQSDKDKDKETSGAKLAAKVLNAICEGAEHTDPSVQLAVLKALLTAATSLHFRLHGECLLQAVRVCYGIALGSSSDSNQGVARNALIQMLTMTFKRLDAQSAANAASLSLPSPIEKGTDDVVEVKANLPEDKAQASVPAESPGRGSTETADDAAPPAGLGRASQSCKELTSLADRGDISGLEAALDRGDTSETPQAEGAGPQSPGMNGCQLQKGEPEPADPIEMDALLVLRALCRLSAQK